MDSPFRSSRDFLALGAEASESPAETERDLFDESDQAAEGRRDLALRRKTFRCEGPHPTIHPVCDMRLPPFS